MVLLSWHAHGRPGLLLRHARKHAAGVKKTSGNPKIRDCLCKHRRQRWRTVPPAPARGFQTSPTMFPQTYLECGGLVLPFLGQLGTIGASSCLCHICTRFKQCQIARRRAQRARIAAGRAAGWSRVHPMVYLVRGAARWWGACRQVGRMAALAIVGGARPCAGPANIAVSLCKCGPARALGAPRSPPRPA